MRQPRELPSPASVQPDEAQSGTPHHTHPLGLLQGDSAQGTVAVGSGPEGLGDDRGLVKASCGGQRGGEPAVGSVPPPRF